MITEKIMKKFDHIILVLFIILLLLFAQGCNNDNEGRKNKPSSRQSKEQLIEANKRAVGTEEQHIDDFLTRYKWDVKETGTGLRYMIYKSGDGRVANEGNVVILEYTVKLITGDVVYSSRDKGPLLFTVGKGEVISGLEEGILFLHVGDKAKFIIPSHLAYGLIGDQEEIHGKATLIYDVEFVGIK
jgi:gliding motility-associated peptidyl-prolyl isomerase